MPVDSVSYRRFLARQELRDRRIVPIRRQSPTNRLRIPTTWPARLGNTARLGKR